MRRHPMILNRRIDAKQASSTIFNRLTPPNPFPENNDSATESFDWPRAILALAAMSILFSIYCDIKTRFFFPPTWITTESYAQWDHIQTKYKPGNGLFLEFKGFAGDEAQFTATVYFRAAFLLYPLPIWAGERSSVVNTGDQLVAANFHPDENWLMARNIRLVITVIDDHGKYGSIYTGVGPPLTDDDLTNPPETNPQSPAGVK